MNQVFLLIQKPLNIAGVSTFTIYSYLTTLCNADEHLQENSCFKGEILWKSLKEYFYY